MAYSPLTGFFGSSLSTPQQPLKSIYNSKLPTPLISLPPSTAFSSVTRTLPVTGQQYTSPVVAQPTAPVAPAPVRPPQAPIFSAPPAPQATATQAPIFSTPALQAPMQPTAPAPDYSEYTNPATGALYSPQEYARVLARRMNAGSVPNYANNAFMQGPQTADQLRGTATDLNNQRNDIAVGATDPYKAASRSGIPYTAADLTAIEKAYAGIYDPALKEVFNKLDKKEKDDAAALEQKNAIALKQTPTYADLHSDSKGLTPSQLQNSLDKVNDDFRQDPATQQYTQAAAGWDALSKVDPDKASSADDISVIYNFAKIMDPNSVVREGEYATVQKYAQSWAQAFGFSAARIFSNTKFLSPEAVKNMQETARAKTSSLQSAYQNSRKTYEKRQKDLLEGRTASGLPNYGYETAIDTPGSTPLSQDEKDYLKSQNFSEEEIQKYQSSFNSVGNTTDSKASEGNRPQRNNNPLNIKSSDFTSKLPGVTGTDSVAASDGGKFLTFDNPQAGFDAAKKLITQPSYSNLTVDAALRRWSGGGYGDEVAPQFGGRTINSLSPLELSGLLHIMAKREGFYA